MRRLTRRAPPRRLAERMACGRRRAVMLHGQARTCQVRDIGDASRRLCGGVRGEVVFWPLSVVSDRLRNVDDTNDVGLGERLVTGSAWATAKPPQFRAIPVKSSSFKTRRAGAWRARDVGNFAPGNGQSRRTRRRRIRHESYGVRWRRCSIEFGQWSKPAECWSDFRRPVQGREKRQ